RAPERTVRRSSSKLEPPCSHVASPEIAATTYSPRRLRMNPATERSHAPLVEEETEPTSAHYRSDDTDETLPLLPTVCAFLVVLSAALFQWAATAGVSSSSYEVAALVALVCAVGVHFLGA